MLTDDCIQADADGPGSDEEAEAEERLVEQLRTAALEEKRLPPPPRGADNASDDDSAYESDEYVEIEWKGPPPNATPSRSSLKGGRSAQRRLAKSRGRSLRIYVAALEDDMGAELEELFTKTVTDLDRLCAERGVHLLLVHIPHARSRGQSREDDLNLRLAEIRLADAVLCLVGNRTGDPVGEVSKFWKSENKWILHGTADDERPVEARSALELELDYAVMRTQASIVDENAFAYTRDLGYARRPTLTATDKIRVVDVRTRLKDHFLAGHVHGDLRQPSAFGRALLADVTSLMNSLFPQPTGPTTAWWTRAAHDAMGAALARGYVSRPALQLPVDNYFAAQPRGSSRPFVILGPTGSGKSALVANCARRYATTTLSANSLVITHFVGCTPKARSLADVLRDVMIELADACEFFDRNVPMDDRQVVAAFPRWLADAVKCTPDDGQLVLILDGLDRLEESQARAEIAGNALAEHVMRLAAEPDVTGEAATARDATLAARAGLVENLEWLPTVLPDRVKLVLSARTGSATAQALELRGYEPLHVVNFDNAERREVIAQYLALFGKRMSAPGFDRLRHELTLWPAFLKYALNELRTHAVYKTLNDNIDAILGRGEAMVETYCDDMLERWEKTYNGKRPGTGDQGNLVRDVLATLVLSRAGVYERDLLGMLGLTARPNEVLKFLQEARHWLLDASGLLLVHDPRLRRAIRARYLSPHGTDMSDVVTRMVKFYDAMATPYDLALRAREVAFGLLALEDAKALEMFVTSPTVVVTLCANDDCRRDLALCWRAVREAHAGEPDFSAASVLEGKMRDMGEQGLKGKPGHDDEIGHVYVVVAGFLRQLGIKDRAVFWYNRATAIIDEMGTRATQHLPTLCDLLDATDGLAHVYAETTVTGVGRDATELFSRSLMLSKSALGEHVRVVEQGLLLARHLSWNGERERAESVLAEAEKVARSLLAPTHPLLIAVAHLTEAVRTRTNETKLGKP